MGIAYEEDNHSPVLREFLGIVTTAAKAAFVNFEIGWRATCCKRTDRWPLPVMETQWATIFLPAASVPKPSERH